MKAELQKLSGKYYGTKVSITLDDGTEGEIKVWIHGKEVNPSPRELEQHGVTQEQWDTDAVLRTVNEGGDEWATNKCIGENFTARDALCIFDSHHESAETYEICRKIVDALNAPRE